MRISCRYPPFRKENRLSLYNAITDPRRIKSRASVERKGRLREMRKLFMGGKKNPCNCGNVTVVFQIASTKVDEVVGARLIFGFSRAIPETPHRLG
jgi:ribosomal protein S27E